MKKTPDVDAATIQFWLHLFERSFFIPRVSSRFDLSLHEEILGWVI